MCFPGLADPWRGLLADPENRVKVMELCFEGGSEALGYAGFGHMERNGEVSKPKSL
jgi:hypothetical protein